MNEKTRKILKDEVKPPSVKKASLVGSLFSGMNQPRKLFDGLWVREVKDRIKDYEKEKPMADSVEKILTKYKNKYGDEKD